MKVSDFGVSHHLPAVQLGAQGRAEVLEGAFLQPVTQIPLV